MGPHSRFPKIPRKLLLPVRPRFHRPPPPPPRLPPRHPPAPTPPTPKTMNPTPSPPNLAAPPFDAARSPPFFGAPTNVGQAVTIRTLEPQIRRLKSPPYAEIRDLAHEMSQACAEPAACQW